MVSLKRLDTSEGETESRQIPFSQIRNLVDAPIDAKIHANKTGIRVSWKKSPLNIVVQHRYQDSGWMPLAVNFKSLAEAIRVAEEGAKDAIRVGMTRVMLDGKTIVTYAAGGEICGN